MGIKLTPTYELLVLDSFTYFRVCEKRRIPDLTVKNAGDANERRFVDYEKSYNTGSYFSCFVRANTGSGSAVITYYGWCVRMYLFFLIVLTGVLVNFDLCLGFYV